MALSRLSEKKLRVWDLSIPGKIARLSPQSLNWHIKQEALVLSPCGILQHREEEHETGYINASHIKSPDDERPEWHYILAQANT